MALPVRGLSPDDAVVTVETTVMYTAYVTAGNDPTTAILTTSISTTLAPTNPIPSSTTDLQTPAASVVSSVPSSIVTTTSSQVSPTSSSSLETASSAQLSIKSTPTGIQASQQSQTASSISWPATASLSNVALLPISSGAAVAAPSQSDLPVATSIASTSNQGFAETHKNAIIGGLVGAIGGAMVIALLILLCCCYRRRKQQDAEAYHHQIRPDMADMREMSFGQVGPLVNINRSSIKSLSPVDGSLIRISLENFQRPFVKNEGWRETVPAGRLRVVNPDRSLPPTPDGSVERLPFFSRLRAPDQAAIADNQYTTQAKPLAKLPVIRIHENISKESVAPSFRSYPSVDTQPLVYQRPPEDPFLAASEQASLSSSRRPKLTPMQGASRTWSALSAAFNFKGRSRRKHLKYLRCTQPYLLLTTREEHLEHLRR
ncbi:hypothetical protein MRB53_039926 [Persea americana]|nr:hypothetical protein MRB53_039926 [Persea americana]